VSEDDTARRRGLWRSVCEGRREVWRIVFLCRFSVGFGLLVAVLIVVPEQSREVLRVVAEDLWPPWPWLLMGVATLLLGLSGWYSGRLVLDLLAPDAYGAKGARGLAARHVPRLAGFVPVAAVALAFWLAAPGASEDARLIWLFAGTTTLMALALYVFFWGRRWLLRWWWRRRGREGEAPERWPLKLFRDPRWRALVLLVVVALGALLFGLLANYGNDGAAMIGAGALALLWAAIVMPLGSTLAWLGNRLRVPFLTLLLAAAIAFTWLELNDNHAVRQADEPITAACEGEVATAAGPVPLAARLEARLDVLEARHPGRVHPLFLVAAQGGGARAAYQTAHVLGHIQDRCPAFANHLLAISGVSGGSVGAAVFAATRDLKGAPGDDACDLGADALELAEGPTYAEIADSVLGRDLLAPVVGGLLFPDLVQRFLFWPIERFSRARALEAALERGFHAASGSCALARPFQDVAQGPALLLNTTEVESGHRVVVSHVRRDAPGRPFLTLDEVAPASTPALSTAAVLSARFPFVTPAATLDRVGGEGRRMRLVDGGYFENSGAATVLDLLHALALHHDREIPRFRPVVLVIEADPCIDRGSREKAEACMDDPVAAQARTGFGELLSPVRALLATRTARGEVAKDGLERLGEVLGHLDPAIRPPVLRLAIERRETAIPLGWMLSGAARAEIRAQLGQSGVCDEEGAVQERNGCALARIQELLAPAP
jgi:predicted acylesterase/phospholipase RssA